MALDRPPGTRPVHPDNFRGELEGEVPLDAGLPGLCPGPTLRHQPGWDLGVLFLRLENPEPGQDSNLGTPSGTDLESAAVDRDWLPTQGRRRGSALYNPCAVRVEVGKSLWRATVRHADGRVLLRRVFCRAGFPIAEGSGLGEGRREGHGEAH